jgi:hypothetical protein
LAKFVAGSEEAQAAFVEQMFHHLVQQPVRAYGPQAMSALQQSFVRDAFHIRKLAVQVLVASSPVGRENKLTEAAGGSE